MAGLEQLIEYIRSLSFTESDIEYLRSKKMLSEKFLAYLENFRFECDIWAIPEGTPIFPNEPIVKVKGPAIQAQFIETMVLLTINHQSLIATKANRIVTAAEGRPVMEFGSRRAQGYDGAIYGARAAYIGGCSGTACTISERDFGVKALGTMAHSWVQLYDTELEAFRAYAKIYPQNSVFLIDTYDTLKSGIKNAIIVGKELVEKGYNFGVRLDSGDISYLTREVRKELDNAGLPQAKISVSNELTEEIITTLVANNAPINSWGVGTHMVTGGTEASFTGVYKLAARHDKSTNTMKPAMKFSDNPAKTTNPGIKNVYRLYDENGMACADILALEDETLETNKEYRYYHPMVDYRQFSFTASKIEPLLKKRVENGNRLQPRLPEAEQLKLSRQTMQNQLATFDESYKRILNPHIYKVSITEELKDLKLKFIEENIK
jgi:nicotinate phosphoribosyltransferase